MKSDFSQILICLTLICMTLVACVPPDAPDAFSCDDLIDTQVASLAFGQMTSVDFEQWAAQTYSVESGDFLHTYKSGVDKETYKRYLWTVGERNFTATFVHDRLGDIAIRSDDLQPSGTEITECLGAPQFYFSTFTMNATLDMALLYPHQGVMVYTIETQMNNFLPPNLEIDGGRRLESTTVSYTMPADIEQQLQTLYNPLDEPKMQQNLSDFKEHVRHWTSWESVQVSTNP